MFNLLPLKPTSSAFAAKHSCKGFTLMEVMISITLTVILLGSLYAVYVTSHRAYRQSVAKAELNQNARIAMERMTRDLRQAERIVTDLPATDSDPLNPPPSQIQFQDGHNTSTIQYLQYSLTGNNLHRKIIHYSFSSDPSAWVAWNSVDALGFSPQEFTDEDVIKADKITSLKFYGSKPITIDLTASDSTNSFLFKTKVEGRNIQ